MRTSSSPVAIIESPLDAFGRIRTSHPLTLFSSKQVVDAQPLFFDDQQTSGSGTSSTYTAASSGSVMAVSANTAGTRVRQSFRRMNYQPGKSQLFFATFLFGAAATGITRRVGLFDSNNGVFLEQISTGPRFVTRKSTSDTATAQTNWNLDKLDDTGPSGITLDLTKGQILVIDYEWLGIGTVRFGFIIDGQFIYAHKAHTANIGTAVYHNNPNLPVRYSISNDGTGAAATMTAICNSVSSEGGFDNPGIQRNIDRVTTPLTTLNNAALYPVLGIKLKTTHQMATVAIRGGSVASPDSGVLRWILCIGPTFTGTAPAWTALTNSAVEYSNTTTNATTIANEDSLGTVLQSGYNVASNTTPSSSLVRVEGLLTIGVTIAGVSQEMWLCAQRATGNTVNIYGSLNWLEVV